MTITIKIPFRIHENSTPASAWKGKKKLGDLHGLPRVLDGKLIAPKVILVSRDRSSPGFYNSSRPETITFSASLHGNPQLEVHYEDDYAIYHLYEDQVIWSDGSPHPRHLQLGIRISRTDGIQEPNLR